MSRVFGVKRLGWFRWEATERITPSALFVQYGRTKRGAIRKLKALRP